MNMRSGLLSLIVLAAALFSSPAVPQGPAQVALVIGNANYADASGPLSTTLNDARTLADELRRNNFEVDLKENLGSDEMKAAIDAFTGKIRSGTSALFYFNGYGIQVGRQTFILPVNVQISSESTVRREGISLDATVASMHRGGAKVKIVIIDAARRSPYETRFRTSPAGLAPLDMPEGTLAMYSAAPGKLAADGKGPNSLLVTELIKELRVTSRPAEEIFNRTRVAVSKATNNEQAPWVATSLIEQYYLGQGRPANTVAPPPVSNVLPPPLSSSPSTSSALPPPITAPSLQPVIATAPPPIATAPRPASPPDPEEQVRRDYQFAEIAGTKKAWDDFLDRYPSGRYSDLARDKVAKLAPSAVVVQPRPPAPAPSAARGAEAPTVAVAPPPPPPTPSQQPAPMIEGADDPAIVELDQKIRQSPTDLNSYYKRGQLYALHGSFRRAIEDFDVVIRLNPKDPEALNNRCWARAVVGDLQAALSDCDEAIKIRPRYLDAFDSRGFINLKLGKPKDAIKDYNAALQINGRHASSLYGRGLAKTKTGDGAGGNSDITAAKRIQPDIVDEFASYGMR